MGLDARRVEFTWGARLATVGHPNPRRLKVITAVKPVWTGKEFKMEVVRDVHAIGAYAGAGYLVYDDPAGTLERVKARTLIGSWTDRKRAAVVAFLEAEAGLPTLPASPQGSAPTTHGETRCSW
jgi:hypothetical protein